MSAEEGPLYLGLDLSTQQIKAIVINSSLKVLFEAKVDFDTDLSKYGIKKGVFVQGSAVYAPVAMWLEAVDLVLERLKELETPFHKIKGISGAGQQHGSVYWNEAAENLLASMDPVRTIVDQLAGKAFAHAFSPNWQDGSTQEECDLFDAILGSPEKLAQVTGSKAHHRFTGPQILRMRRHHPEVYRKAHRITLVSSFFASLFLGKIAPLDISDVCGMNLWDINAGDWSEDLLDLTAGDDGIQSLKERLGYVHKDSGNTMGFISAYFTKRYKFPHDCGIIPFTGDNPSTILSLPLRSLDAIVSLGTSTTFLMSTPKYVPHPAYHFFNHPTTPGLYMFMLCYKNGSLAREQIRDALPKSNTCDPWSNFNKVALDSYPLGQKNSSDPMRLGLFFPLPEIVPNVGAGIWRFVCDSMRKNLTELSEKWGPEDDVRTIVESQVLSLRLRSRKLVHPPAVGIPPQPSRIYLVGGGSRNPAIAQIIGDVLGGAEGVWKLDAGENACALGGAYKAVWALERKNGETFEELIGKRWKEGNTAKKIETGYKAELWERYDKILEPFEQMEQLVLARGLEKPQTKFSPALQS